MPAAEGKLGTLGEVGEGSVINSPENRTLAAAPMAAGIEGEANTWIAAFSYRMSIGSQSRLQQEWPCPVLPCS
jgi:hypothetical protein